MRKTTFAIIAACCITIIILAAGCSENERAKNYGGTMTIDLPAGQKLETITWKDGVEVWYLTRPFRAGELPETHSFQEESKFGLVQGTIIIKEKL